MYYILGFKIYRLTFKFDELKLCTDETRQKKTMQNHEREHVFICMLANENLVFTLASAMKDANGRKIKFTDRSYFELSGE
jgi:hypothetical protein